eukprot:s3260_g2.t1
MLIVEGQSPPGDAFDESCVSTNLIKPFSALSSHVCTASVFAMAFLSGLRLTANLFPFMDSVMTGPRDWDISLTEASEELDMHYLNAEENLYQQTLRAATYINAEAKKTQEQVCGIFEAIGQAFACPVGALRPWQSAVCTKVAAAALVSVVAVDNLWLYVAITLGMALVIGLALCSAADECPAERFACRKRSC